MTQGQLQPLLRHIQKLVGAGESEAITDRELLARFTTLREEAAFATLVHRHGPLVLGTCRRILQNVHDAEDAFQATFLVLARKAALLRWQESVASWLYTVAVRVASKVRARTARQPAQHQQVEVMSQTDPHETASAHEL